MTSLAAWIRRWPVDDALALMVVLARRRIGLEHRALRLLDLQEERVAVVATEHQHDPGAGADAADADHLERGVDEAVAVEQRRGGPRRAVSR